MITFTFWFFFFSKKISMNIEFLYHGVNLLNLHVCISGIHIRQLINNHFFKKKLKRKCKLYKKNFTFKHLYRLRLLFN